MTDAERERILDKRIQARLATDRAYLNAENAEEQSNREWEIEREEDERLGCAIYIQLISSREA